MNQKIKPANSAQEGAAETFKTAKKLKRSLLLTIGTLVPCAAALVYGVVRVEQPGGAEIKKISLLFSALSLPVYLIVLILKESIDARKDRKKITALVTELTEDLSMADVSNHDQQPESGGAIKSGHTSKASELVQKIVQVINA